MKLKLLSVTLLSTMLFAACGSEKTETKEEVKEVATVAAETYHANIEESKVKWKGEVAGVYGHEGYVNLQSGWISAEGEAITGGEIVIDMSNIVPTDSASYKDSDGGRITDLQGHLSNNDFFNIDSFPTAKFVVTSVEENSVKGNLTVRDKTNEETIELESFTTVDGALTAKGTLVFNRQNYDVAWKHYMKDMVLSNDISLTFTLVAKK
jgi:polyisoprenoid-binding protein YceI